MSVKKSDRRSRQRAADLAEARADIAEANDLINELIAMQRDIQEVGQDVGPEEMIAVLLMLLSKLEETDVNRLSLTVAVAVDRIMKLEASS